MKLFDRSLGDAPEVWWKWRDTDCRGVAFSPDGNVLAVAAGTSGKLRAWNFAEECGSEFAGAQFSGTARSVAFSPDGKYLALDQWDNEDRVPGPGVVRVWSVEKESNPRDLVRLNYPARCVAFANDSATLAAGMSGRTGDWAPAVEVWTAVTGGNIKSLPAVNAVAGPTVAFARNAPLLALTDREGGKLYHLPILAPHERGFISDGEPTAVALRADGVVGAIALEGVILLWTVARGVEYARLEKHADRISALAFTLDGRTLISGGYDRAVREWQVPDPPKRPAKREPGTQRERTPVVCPAFIANRPSPVTSRREERNQDHRQR